MVEKLKHTGKRIEDEGKKEVNPLNLKVEHLLIKDLKSLKKGLK